MYKTILFVYFFSFMSLILFFYISIFVEVAVILSFALLLLLDLLLPSTIKNMYFIWSQGSHAGTKPRLAKENAWQSLQVVLLQSSFGKNNNTYLLLLFLT